MALGKSAIEDVPGHGSGKHFRGGHNEKGRETPPPFLSSAVSLERAKLRNRKCSPSTSLSGPAADAPDEELTEDSARIAVHFSLSASISQPKRESHAVRILRRVKEENAGDHRSLTNDKGYKKNVRLVVSSQGCGIRSVRYNKRRTRITRLPSSLVLIKCWMFFFLPQLRFRLPIFYVPFPLPSSSTSSGGGWLLRGR